VLTNIRPYDGGVLVNLFPPIVDEDEYRKNKDEENSSEGLNENQG